MALGRRIWAAAGLVALLASMYAVPRLLVDSSLTREEMVWALAMHLIALPLVVGLGFRWIGRR